MGLRISWNAEDRACSVSSIRLLSVIKEDETFLFVSAVHNVINFYHRSVRINRKGRGGHLLFLQPFEPWAGVQEPQNSFTGSAGCLQLKPIKLSHFQAPVTSKWRLFAEHKPDGVGLIWSAQDYKRQQQNPWAVANSPPQLKASHDENLGARSLAGEEQHANVAGARSASERLTQISPRDFSTCK